MRPPRAPCPSSRPISARRSPVFPNPGTAARSRRSSSCNLSESHESHRHRVFRLAASRHPALGRRSGARRLHVLGKGAARADVLYGGLRSLQLRGRSAYPQDRAAGRARPRAERHARVHGAKPLRGDRGSARDPHARPIARRRGVRPRRRRRLRARRGADRGEAGAGHADLRSGHQGRGGERPDERAGPSRLCRPSIDHGKRRDRRLARLQGQPHLHRPARRRNVRGHSRRQMGGGPRETCRSARSQCGDGKLLPGAEGAAFAVKRVLLLLPTTGYRNNDFLAAAAKLGVEIVPAGNYCHQLAPSWGLAPIMALHFDQPAQAAKTVLREMNGTPDAVLAVDDSGVELAALLAERLGLPGNPTDAVRRVRDKLAFRRLLEAHELRCPAFRHLPSGEDPRELLPELEFPVVVKARRLSASRGVIRADDAEALSRAVNWVRAIQLRADRDAQDLGLVIEAFIPGREYALGGSLQRGELTTLALFDKPDPLDGPYFEETLYITPSRPPQARQDRIHQ